MTTTARTLAILATLATGCARPDDPEIHTAALEQHFPEAHVTSVLDGEIIHAALVDEASGEERAWLSAHPGFELIEYVIQTDGGESFFDHMAVEITEPEAAGAALYTIWQATRSAAGPFEAAEPLGGWGLPNPVPPGQPAGQNAGCDWVPDSWETPCIKECCRAHDWCYAQNGCSASSWLPRIGSAACKCCNRAVTSCIAACVVAGL